MRLGSSEYVMGALYKGMFGAAILAAGGFYYVTMKFMTGGARFPMKLGMKS